MILFLTQLTFTSNYFINYFISAALATQDVVPAQHGWHRGEGEGHGDDGVHHLLQKVLTKMVNISIVEAAVPEPAHSEAFYHVQEVIDGKRDRAYSAGTL